MKKCPFCGEQIADDAKQCPICGEMLNEDNVPKNDNSDSKKCKYCCAEIPKDAQKCPNCGEWLNEENRPSNKIWGKIKGCGCLIIIIIILIIMLPWIIAGGIVASLPEEKPDVPDGYEETTDWYKDFSPAEKMLYGYPFRYTYPDGSIVDIDSTFTGKLNTLSCSKEAIDKIKQYCFNPDFKFGKYKECRDEIALRYCKRKYDLPANTEDADIAMQKYYNFDYGFDFNDPVHTMSLFPIDPAGKINFKDCTSTQDGVGTSFDTECPAVLEINSKCLQLKREKKLDCIVETTQKHFENFDVIMTKLQKEAHYDAI